ncbi:hypothetical protein HKD37_16G045845 [Glycine soja]
MHTKRCSVKRVQKLEAELNKLESEAALSGLKINFAKSRFGAGLLMQQNGELWTRVLNSKYGGWRNLEETGNSAKQCVWWRDVKQAFNQSQQGLVIQNNMRWKVGDGEKTDKWINQEESLAERYPRLFIISSQQNHTIRQMGTQNNTGWEWNFSWRRLLFDNEIDTAISFLREQIDIWEWIEDSSGIYTTRSAYNLIWEEIAGGQKEDWSMELWKTKIPSKMRGRLPTKQNLRKRNIQINNMLCPFCSGAMEDECHLFIHCIKIQPIWWESMSWMNVKGAFPFSPKQHFIHHISIQMEGLRAKRWRYWWLAVTWSTWKLRNKILFANAEFYTNRLFEDVIFIIWTWLRQFEKDFTVHYNQWSTICLPKEEGGLGIKEISKFNEALLGKWRQHQSTLVATLYLGFSSTQDNVGSVGFERRQYGFFGSVVLWVPARTMWVFRQCRGFYGFDQLQCGCRRSGFRQISGGRRNRTVISGRRRKRTEISGRRMTKRRGRARFSNARGF